MKNVRSLLLSACVLGLGLAALGTASADDNKRRIVRRRPPVVRPPAPIVHPRPHSPRIVKEVNERFEGLQTIQVRRLLGLGPQYRGQRLQRVMMVASTDYGRGQAQLLINGQPVGAPQTVGYSSGRFIFTLPVRNVLGRDILSLQIQLRGRFWVERVGARLGHGGMFRDQIIKKNLWETFHGFNILPVRMKLGLDQSFRGRKLKAITVKARSAMGRGQAQLLVNGQPSGMPITLSTWAQEQTIFLPQHMNTLGTNVRGIQLQLRGNITVESLGAIVSRSGGYNPGPAFPRSIDQRVFKRLAGSTTTSIASLLNLGYNQRHGRVSSVTIYAKSQMMVRPPMRPIPGRIHPRRPTVRPHRPIVRPPMVRSGKAQLCEASRWGRGQCSAFQMVNRHETAMTFTAHNSTLDDLTLNTFGPMTISRVIVRFERY